MFAYDALYLYLVTALTSSVLTQLLLISQVWKGWQMIPRRNFQRWEAGKLPWTLEPSSLSRSHCFGSEGHCFSRIILIKEWLLVAAIFNAELTFTTIIHTSQSQYSIYIINKDTSQAGNACYFEVFLAGFHFATKQNEPSDKQSLAKRMRLRIVGFLFDLKCGCCVTTLWSVSLWL